MIKNRNIKIVEDCAQAHGTTLGKHVGTFGDIGTFSFFQVKIWEVLATEVQLLQIKRNLGILSRPGIAEL